MKKNLIFIYGADSYRSFEYLKALKNKFIDRGLGETNLQVIDGKNIKNPMQLLSAFQIMPFLSDKRLVVVMKFLSQNKKVAGDCVDILDKIPDTSVVVFYEGASPDMRIRMARALQKNAQIKDFLPLENYQRKKWAQQIFKRNNKTILPEALDFLLTRKKGESLGGLIMELNKLCLLNAEPISVSDVANNITAQFDDKVYHFSGVFLKSFSRQEIFRRLDRLRFQGEDENMIFFTLVNLIRQVLSTKEYQNPSAKELMRDLKISYYPALQLCEAKLPSAFLLEKLFQEFFAYDLAIKTGKMKIGIAIDLIIDKWVKIREG
ncbi:MAG: hypothetical protein CEN89_619 [Candidatus Berkelbacteria bacterium Licking1014_7]|uniref:Uncharacterized protein n=1 Tax=Candidatus Berkelbacteria bacterium Licking1014_7 TaxID=2017147 RepID=A0A554LI67_9BACT|nr:MAG: hypothetical protein CEN89_619 [Candidatus Berkelbacteria bacterium Licking1014_7]